jgi:hypothetical protein
MNKPPWLIGSLLLLAACVGSVEPRAGSPAPPAGGGAPPTSGNPPGNGMPPSTMTGGNPSMPGPGEPPPPPRERPAAAAVPTTRLARLSHRQWENTVRDLLRLPAAPGLAVKFTADAFKTFANDGGSLSVTESLRADYQTAAESLAQKIALDPAAVARLVPPGAPAGKERALAFVKDFGRRAYRRPLDDEEVAAFTTLFERGPTLLPERDAFAAGVQLVLEAMLQSPHFLYRTELTAGQAQAQGRLRLGDHEVAAKLSYALIGSMPDDDLFAAAAAGGLRSHDQVVDQAERLLGKGGEPGLTFHEELLTLRGLAVEIEKDATRFPEFKPAWRDSIAKESELFLRDVFTGGRGLADLLTAPFTFVDATLAPLYGVKAPAGGAFARVDLDPKQRAGLLTQTAFLSRHGETESDPILRGAFINHTLLCMDLAPPPGVLESITDPPASARSNRQRVTAVTSSAVCAACHAAYINPAGFAFEHYDPLGRYRTTESGLPVNAADSYSFASGPRSFADAVEFSRLLAESPEVHACYARNWFAFLEGRLPRAEDEPFIGWLAERSLAGRSSLRALALTVVTDDSFLTRLP